MEGLSGDPPTHKGSRRAREVIAGSPGSPAGGPAQPPPAPRAWVAALAILGKAANSIVVFCSHVGRGLRTVGDVMMAGVLVGRQIEIRFGGASGGTIPRAIRLAPSGSTRSGR